MDLRDNLLALSTHVHSGAAGQGSGSLGPLVRADFTTAAAPAAPGAAVGRFYVVTGDRPGFRSGVAGAAEQLESQANKAAASGYASLDAGTLVPSAQIPVITDTQHGVRALANAHAHSALSGIGATDHHSNANDHVNTIVAHGPSAHTTGTAWRALYLNSLGDETELILGASGTVFQSNGASSAPSFATPTTAAHGASSHDDRTRKLLYGVGMHGTDTAGGVTDLGAITSGSVGTPVIALSDAVDDGVSFIAMMPSDMVAGTPTAVIILRTATSHASNWAVLLNALELGVGANILDGGTNTDTTISGGSSTNVQRATLTFPIATLAPNDVFRLDFERNASTDSASDTATDVIHFLAIELAYTADM